MAARRKTSRRKAAPKRKAAPPRKTAKRRAPRKQAAPRRNARRALPNDDAWRELVETAIEKPAPDVSAVPNRRKSK